MGMYYPHVLDTPVSAAVAAYAELPEHITKGAL